MTTQWRWWRFLLAALAAVFVGLFGATISSAATLAHLDTRVGASLVGFAPMESPSATTECAATYAYDSTAPRVRGDEEPAAWHGPRAMPAVAPAGGPPPLSRVATAAKAGGESVDLFRHVSPGELADIQKSGVFWPGAGSMEGKWFAESAEHAQQWGNALNGGQGAVVTTRVPTSVADKMMRLEKLDGIGPARYADDLSLLNRTMNGIRVLP